jgi:type II secretory pathway pseudopilin PulG
MRKTYKAFTLVEMLIVMGIIIILMAVGIASGRFAIRRANKIEHQNAAEQIYQALQAYYSDYREYPDKGPANDETPQTLITGTTSEDDDSLAEYIDDFDGGSEASYAYHVDTSGQEVLICVTYGGEADTNELGIYCTGNAIGGSLISGAPSEKDIDYGSADYNLAEDLFDATHCSDWDPATEWDGVCDEISYTPPASP